MKIKIFAKTLLVALVATFAVGATTAPAQADTGGYPYADATKIEASTWGYTDCKGYCSGYGYIGSTKYYYYSERGYGIRNCTDYVAWKLESLGVSSQLTRGRGNGNQWDDSSAGVTLTNTPEVGDAAVWNFNHVAFVEEVRPKASGGLEARVSEYNADYNGNFSNHRWVTADKYVDFNGVGTPLGGGSTTPAPAAKRADIIVTGSDNIWAVATSNGSSFEGSGHWLSGWGKGDWTGFADVNGDGKSDVVVHDPAARAFKVALSNGAGSFNGAGAWFSDWGVGDWTGLADVTGDGKADLITNDGSVWLVAFSTGSSFTGFGVGLNGWPKGDWAGLADANGDGKADIIVHNPQDATFSVAISGGTGMFGSPGTGTWLWGWGSGDWIGVADITGDKKADLVVHGPDNNWVVATSTGSSFSGFGTGFSGWGKGDFTALADANGDGKADIIVHNPQDATFAVAISGGSGYFGSPGSGTWLSGWGAGTWGAAGDVNNG